MRMKWIVAVAALATHMTAGAALAQRPGRLPEEDGGLIQWLMAAGLALVICAPAFLNSKRSHLT